MPLLERLVMKFFIFLLITLGLCLMAESLCALESVERGGIQFSFANPQIVSLDSDMFFSFDIMAAASSEGVMPRLGTGIVVFTYNSEVFGTWVKTNGNAITSKGSLISTSPFALYNMIVNDNQASRLAITFEYTATPGGGNYLAISPQQLVNVKLRIQSGGYAGLSFAAGSMQEEQYQDDNFTLLSPVIAVATENSIIPSIPVELALSVVNGEIQLSWQEVPGCTYNVYSCSDPADLNWQLEVAGIEVPAWNNSSLQAKRFFYVTARSNTQGRQP